MSQPTETELRHAVIALASAISDDRIQEAVSALRALGRRCAGENQSRIEFVERIEDMSPTGRLRILQQEDGDIIVCVIEDSGRMSDVEFCVPGFGGGESPRTIAALRALAQAMVDDNREEPQARARR